MKDKYDKKVMRLLELLDDDDVQAKIKYIVTGEELPSDVVDIEEYEALKVDYDDICRQKTELENMVNNLQQEKQQLQQSFGAISENQNLQLAKINEELAYQQQIATKYKQQAEAIQETYLTEKDKLIDEIRKLQQELVDLKDFAEKLNAQKEFWQAKAQNK